MTLARAYSIGDDAFRDIRANFHIFTSYSKSFIFYVKYFELMEIKLIPVF